MSLRAFGRKPSWVSGLAQALLEKEDANILVVDWLYGASYAYNYVVNNYKEVAVQISILINQLTVSVLYLCNISFVLALVSGWTNIYQCVCHLRSLTVFFCSAGAEQWC